MGKIPAFRYGPDQQVQQRTKHRQQHKQQQQGLQHRTGAHFTAPFHPPCRG
ncbi:hypothetical protein UUU_00720 [Klebsiella pneumoniae subsp. pneumoniae DSM 30104 = JCM 1662 = NBRC 14940]|nr:hypothetical protein UUU_00720 [Klebsiella pneumoniae subsp. pneumoniae DSM 30104 = JCM 1662 = NBRC 14940]